MTSSEYRAWFKGFSEIVAKHNDDISLGLVYIKVHERVEQLNEVPTPYPIFLDHFWPFPERPWFMDTDAKVGWLRELYWYCVRDSTRFFTPDVGFMELGRRDAIACLRPTQTEVKSSV